MLPANLREACASVFGANPGSFEGGSLGVVGGMMGESSSNASPGKCDPPLNDLAMSH